jgi:hypothetical protein
MMKPDDFTRFADDLRDHAGLSVTLDIDSASDGLHVLTINGVDFFFHSNGSGYDGWGRAISQGGNGHAK